MALSEMHEAVMRLSDEVIRLTTQMASLTARDAGDIHSYVGDTSPAVRARFFKTSNDSDRNRLDGCDEYIANLEVTMPVMTDTLEAHQVQMEKQAEDMKSPQADVGASFPRAATSPERKGDDRTVTDRRRGSTALSRSVGKWHSGRTGA